MTPRCLLLHLAGALIVAAGGWPALAQTSDRAILNDLRECAKISAVSARVACYDAHMAAGQREADTPPPARDKPAAARVPEGFGGASVRSAARQADDEAEHAVTARVAAVTERGPGLYRITLEDGAQWQFADSARATYDPPTRGSTIEIRRGALGGFLMRYADQASVRVIRLR